MLLNLYLVVGLLVFNYLTNTSYRFSLLILFFLGSLWLLQAFHYRSPFYDERVGRLWSFVVLHNMWTLVCLLLSAAVYRDLANLLPYWIMGGLLLSVYCLIFKSRGAKAFEIHVDYITDDETLTLHLQVLLELAFSENARAKDRLNGYIQYHKKFCLDASCPIRSENIFRRNTQAISSYEQYTTRKYGNLTNFVTHLFGVGLKKYRDSASMRILYSYYLMEMAKNMQQAVEQLALCFNDPQLKIDELYTVERIRRSIVDEAKNSQDVTSRELVLSSRQDFNFRLRELLESISAGMLELWWNLIRDSPGKPM